MRFAKLFAICSTSLTCVFAHAQNHQEITSVLPTSSDSFYLKLGTGASFSRKANVTAPVAVWDSCPEGYDTNLKQAPILSVGLGYHVNEALSLDLTYSYRPHYEYEKYQTADDPEDPGYLGPKTRRYKLDVSSLILNANLKGRGYENFSWDIGAKGDYLQPFVGLGIGISQHKIYNFISTGLDPEEGTSIPAFGSESSYTLRYAFTYQTQLGLEYVSINGWTLSGGYRWFDGGNFKGPSYVRGPSGTAYDISSNEWRQHLQAHEVFIEWSTRI